ERGASLRFGHETCVLPLACLLELDNVNYHTTDLADLHNHWQNYNIFPMACNVQMVFYRPVNGAGDVLVKVLLNEHEARLPIATTMFPYYRWSDFRKYYVEKLKTPIDWKN
ncbi:MAG: histidine-type phosphatase, partial [Muribaculaceae bacterium]|nr:histidine-type phosphatase [Muribaculaceae bacterium]